MTADGIAALRAERRWQPGFVRASPLFWPLKQAAMKFTDDSSWPDVEQYARAFRGEAIVAFIPAPPRRRRERAAAPVRYDATILSSRRVPTRARDWHDFMNALVWATFPRAKLALHARQHRAITSRADPREKHLPNARTRELDALAMLDEGGVLLVHQRIAASPRAIVFGHAIYEHLLDPSLRIHGRTLSLALDAAAPPDDAALLASTDDLLAAALDSPATCCTPDALGRVDIDERLL